MTRPIFLLSLPRSGSTLLQRLLATHPRIATASEPWLLLPLISGFDEGHVFATYQQGHLAQAFEDFLAFLPRGEESYRAAVRAFAGTLYEAATQPPAELFLDKTPRYHLIAEELAVCFPEAEFLLLWRNPLAVVASLVDSFGGSWILHRNRVDLYHGMHHLLAFQRRHRERIHSLRYEDLVDDPDEEVASVFRHLGLDDPGDASRRYRDICLEGRMGDKKGERLYRQVSTASRDRWRETFHNLPRRLWARRYLRWIGTSGLAAAGYDHQEILTLLESRPPGWRRTASDLSNMLAGWSRVAFERSFFEKKRNLTERGLGIDVPVE